MIIKRLGYWPLRALVSLIILVEFHTRKLIPAAREPPDLCQAYCTWLIYVTIFEVKCFMKFTITNIFLIQKSDGPH